MIDVFKKGNALKRVGSDLEKIILILDLNMKARSGLNFASFFGQTVQLESAHTIPHLLV